MRLLRCAAELLHQQVLQLLLGDALESPGVVTEPKLRREDVPDFLEGERVAHLRGGAMGISGARVQRSVSEAQLAQLDRTGVARK